MLHLSLVTMLALGQGTPTPAPIQPVRQPFQTAPATWVASPPDPTPNAGAPDVPKNGDAKKEEKKDEKEAKPEKPPEYSPFLKPRDDRGGFAHRLYKEYFDAWFPPDDQPDEPEKPRRALPSPWSSPPFPGSEYQGYPLIGVPPDPSAGPLMKALYGANTPFSEAVKESRITFNGWVTSAGTWSTAHQSNVPTSYWIVPNSLQLDQVVFKLERQADTVQTDHLDWGFRSIALYGMDYRYTTAGGWGSNQLLKHNLLYGWDPVEQYVNVYIPGFLGGTDVRVGRWIACPDIEAQYAPDNYLGSHSILFTYDTYTQTGVMVSQKLNDRWMVQGVLHAGTDMAPWYPGALPTAAFGVRWVSKDNNNAFYTWANALNSAKFRHFTVDGQPAGHDNFNYVVTTWEHRFSKYVHTKTEAYYMWQFDAELGGTPSLGPVQTFGGGGGDGVLLPGLSNTWGVLNYTMVQLSDKAYTTVRNEVFRDERGMRTGTPGTYTSHTVGVSITPNSVYQIRPEIGYYRNWENKAFDNGRLHGLWLYGFDMTMRF